MTQQEQNRIWKIGVNLALNKFGIPILQIEDPESTLFAKKQIQMPEIHIDAIEYLYKCKKTI